MGFVNSLHSLSDIGLVVLRFVLAAIFWVHGRQKSAMWHMQPSDKMPKGMLGILRFLSVAEPLGAVALVVGFATPLAALCYSVIMVGAIKMKVMRWKIPFMAQNATGWEFDLLILVAMIALIFVGAGAYSVDHLVLGF